MSRGFRHARSTTRSRTSSRLLLGVCATARAQWRSIGFNMRARGLHPVASYKPDENQWFS
eukprot:6564794-Pyramimonas_sp.AAC.1